MTAPDEFDDDELLFDDELDAVDDDELDDDAVERLIALFSIICALLVNTRFDNFLKVCVKFLDASAKAGLSVFISVSFVTSIDVFCCC